MARWRDGEMARWRDGFFLQREKEKKRLYGECKSGVICAFITITCEITFGAHMTHDGTVDHSKIKSV